MAHPNLVDRYALCDTPVTLDGKPAKIAGAKRDFATIRTLPDGASYEWAWETVARVVANGGAFKS